MMVNVLVHVDIRKDITKENRQKISMTATGCKT